MTTVVDLDAIPFAFPGEPPATGWRLGLIGDPVDHSLSPALQGAGLRELGLHGTYERWQTAAGAIPDRVTSIRLPGFLGANVTVPHKEAVIAHLDGITPLAARVGAVNTIVRRDERLIGDNSDVAGFTGALAQHTGPLDGRTAVVLGAGGASRAVLVGLERLGAERILVANRTVARADELIRDLECRSATSIPLTQAALVDVLPRTTVLVNATAIGWHAGELPLDAELLDTLPADAHVTDLTYRDTDLLLAARGRGLATSDGLEMLVLQGSEALRRWSGQEPPVDAMRAAAIAARG
ncbi:MAG TPA: shikimate dehydrogenase [Thermomicrobiales bacterium]|jgi:shikimate dehydrogenase|nr:shikimate dehydrogenase [Thermomicrobiales bacterium]